MYAQATVQACTCEADEGAKLRGGPLWGRGGAVAANTVTSVLLESEELHEIASQLSDFLN